LGSRKPGVEIGQSPRAQGALFGRAALLALAAAAARGLGGQRWEQAEVDVHWLEGAGTVRLCGKMPAGDVAEQGAEGGRDRWRLPDRAPTFRRRRLARKQPDGGAFDIAFAARDLARKAQARGDAEPQLAVDQLGRIQEGVAMEPAKAGKLRLGEARDQAEGAHLLAVLELGLEADHVPQGAERIVLSQLHDGIGALAAAMGI